jgi:hypothetical protein
LGIAVGGLLPLFQIAHDEAICMASGLGSDQFAHALAGHFRSNGKGVGAKSGKFDHAGFEHARTFPVAAQKAGMSGRVKSSLQRRREFGKQLGFGYREIVRLLLFLTARAK